MKINNTIKHFLTIIFLIIVIITTVYSLYNISVSTTAITYYCMNIFVTYNQNVSSSHHSWSEGKEIYKIIIIHFSHILILIHTHISSRIETWLLGILMVLLFTRCSQSISLPFAKWNEKKARNIIIIIVWRKKKNQLMHYQPNSLWNTQF